MDRESIIRARLLKWRPDPDKSNEQIVKMLREELGDEVSEEELLSLESDPDYIRDITQRHVARIMRDEATIWMKLAEKAGSGNIAAMKLYFALTNRGTAKLVIHENGGQKQVDYSNLSDDELDAIIRRGS